MQNEIHKWQLKTFPESDEISKYYHLKKEIDELGDELHTKEIDREKLALELADCALLLFGIAGLQDIDLLDAVKEKFEINKKRNWKAPVNGVYFHEKNKSDAS